MDQPNLECLHGRFSATVNVFRLQKGVVEAHPENRADSFTADVYIKCDECGESFEFIGPPCGMSFREASVSIDRLELRIPIQPRRG